MLPEELVEVAYTALRIASNCAMALAEHNLLEEPNSDRIVRELKNLAAKLEGLHGLGPDTLPTAQSAALHSAAQQIENLGKAHRGL